MIPGSLRRPRANRKLLIEPFKILPTDVESILVYKKGKNSYIVYAFKKNNNSFELVNGFPQESSIISTNDIFQISNKYLNQINSTISFINFKLTKKYKKRPMSLQFNLELENSSINARRPPDGDEEKTCKFPCKEGEGKCTVQENESGHENWFCIGEKCKKEDANAKLVENNINSDFSTQDSLLYAFRNNYMANSSKGNDFISMYYDLSADMNSDSMTLGFAIQTIDFVVTHVLPLTQQLSNNPRSSNILYTVSKKDSLINYLQIARNKYTSDYSKSQIDTLIYYVNEYNNKTHSYITQSLN